jgi:hypothetical protein
MQVAIKKETLTQAVEIVSSYPVAYARYKDLNLLWVDTAEKNSFLYDDAELVEAQITGWDEDSDLSLSEAKWEYRDINADMGEPSYDAFKILEALTSVVERQLSGRSTPSLGSSNDYQRGRD